LFLTVSAFAHAIRSSWLWLWFGLQRDALAF